MLPPVGDIGLRVGDRGLRVGDIGLRVGDIGLRVGDIGPCVGDRGLRSDVSVMDVVDTPLSRREELDC